MSDTVDENYRERSERTGPVHRPSFIGVDDPAEATDTPVEDVLTVEPAPEITITVDDDAWAVERSTADAASLSVGDAVQFSKPMAATDVSAFAQVSGDTNPLHLDGDFAEGTRFDGRIVHGTLVAGTVSAALARFPGVTIYLSQDLEFLAPVEVGQTVTATCEIVEDFGDERYRLHTTVTTDDDTTVIDGEAVVLIADDPDPDAGSSS